MSSHNFDPHYAYLNLSGKKQMRNKQARDSVRHTQRTWANCRKKQQ